MPRASYGADVFSPVRSNVSLSDDNLCSIGRESDLLKDWQEPQRGTSNPVGKRNNLPFFNIEEETLKDNLQSAIKVDKKLIKKNKKDSSLESCSSRLSNVTTRRGNSSHRSKKELCVTQENHSSVNAKESRTRKTIRNQFESNKELLPNKNMKNKYLSSALVNSADSSKESCPNKIKQTESSSLSVNLADSNEELHPSKITLNKESSSLLINSSASTEELLHRKFKQGQHLSSSNFNEELQSKNSSASVADTNLYISPNKMIQNHDSSPSSEKHVDSKKESLHRKANQNKDSSSLTDLANLKKELPTRKIKQNVVSSVNSTESKKELRNVEHSKESSSYSVDPAAESERNFSNEVKQGSSLNLVSLAFNLDVGSGNLENNCQVQEILTNGNEVLKKSHSKSMKTKKDSEVKRPTQVENRFSTSVSERKMPDEADPVEEIYRGAVVDENFNADSTLSSSESKLNPIHRNIIEEIVKDAVSFEFDKIRQMVYSQHLQVLKYIDGNTANYELLKIIDVLMEENRKLKEIIACQKS